MALVVLQNMADLEKVGGLFSEICPASSPDAYQAIGIKAEVFSDAEEEEYLVPVTFPGIKAEPEVSCVLLGGFHKYRYCLFYELRCSEQLTFVRGFFLPKQRNFIDQKISHIFLFYPIQ
jgi:hypothetical protein